MNGDELIDREVIGRSQVFVSELVAQNVAQQPYIAVIRNSVKLVVRRHHRADSAFANTGLKWRQEKFANGSLAIIGGSNVGSCLRLAVDGKVLQRSEHVVAID